MWVKLHVPPKVPPSQGRINESNGPIGSLSSFCDFISSLPGFAFGASCSYRLLRPACSRKWPCIPLWHGSDIIRITDGDSRHGLRQNDVLCRSEIPFYSALQDPDRGGMGRDSNLVFTVSWFDPTMDQNRKFTLTFYPGDNSVEMVRHFQHIFLTFLLVYMYVLALLHSTILRWRGCSSAATDVKAWQPRICSSATLLLCSLDDS